MTAKRAAVVMGRATATRRHMVWKAVVQREMAVWVAVVGVVSPQIRGRGVRCEVAVDIGDLGKVPAQMRRLEVQVILRGVVIWRGVRWLGVVGEKSSSDSACRR